MPRRISCKHLLLIIVGLGCSASGWNGETPSVSLTATPRTARSDVHPQNDQEPESRTTKKRHTESRFTVPLSFEKNEGQADANVKFLARGKGYTLSLTSTEAVMSLRRPSDSRAAAGRETQSLTIRLQPIDANTAPRIVGDSMLPVKVNYVRPGGSHDTLTGIPTYQRVRYEAIYPGIDLVYYDNGQQLEYDFIVAPHANPDRIRLAFAGADALSLDPSGNLVVRTPAGELRQPPPVIYQEVDGARTLVSGGYVLDGVDRIRFRLGAYDSTRPLVIDPVVAYSTYFGANVEESGWDIAVDSGGNAYVTGARPSVRSPDAYDYDAYVAKYSPAGALLWITNIGDTCDDEGRGIAVDAAGNVYVTGQLGNCYPFPTLHAGAFVAKLNAAGGGSYIFAFSDYWYGGADVGQAVAAGAGGVAYVTGVTTSSEFPVTAGAFQRTFAGGIGDGFIVKVNASGTALLYATYLGGTAYESLNDLAVDGAGHAYVVGSTESQDFPTLNAFQPGHPGWGPGDQAGFVTKLSANGSALVYSTYLGGGPSDIAQGVVVDSLGHAYVVGGTQSSAFPITPGVVQPDPGDNRLCYYTICTDAFVSKLHPSGSALVYSTYLGGNIFDVGTGIAVDAAGNAYVTGNTWSLDFPTVDAFQPNPAGHQDAFVAKLNPTASALVYSSYLGGSPVGENSLEGEDGGLRIAVDATGASAYVVGYTRSTNFPVINANQPVFGGGACGVLGYTCADAFVIKIGTTCTYSIAPVSRAVAAAGSAGTVAVTASSNTCSWTATSTAAWITVTSGATGSGNGSVGYSVAPNTGTSQRIGTITIAGQPFTVTQSAPVAMSVAVTTPNGGEKLFIGTPYTIAWTAEGATSFDVAASADGGATYSPIAGCVGLAGSARGCVWMSPGPATTNARVRVTARNAGGNVADASNAVFTILSGTPSITVSFPNTSANVGIGSTQAVKWTHNLGTQSFVKIELSRDGGMTFAETLTAAHRNTKATSGTYNWQVSGPATAGAQARIRISWTSGPVSDVSNANFIIAPVFINVTAPAAGSNWGFGTKQKQTWTSNLGALDRVDVKLSTAGGNGPFATLDGGSSIVATLNRANVVVPASATATARVRVVWSNPPVGFSSVGTNPANFVIAAPFVNVTAPAAGAVWAIGTAKTITWTHNLGALENVEIRVSKDAGATYPVLITASTPSDGKHAVTVDARWGPQSVTRLKITWLKTTSVVGVSANFTIQP